jgi:hypothetical protein
MEEDLTAKQPHPVRTRFELAIGRMMDAWLIAGRVQVSADDVKLAREFLELSGWRVEEAGHANLRLVHRDGRSEEVTREAAVMTALRRLATRR